MTTKKANAKQHGQFLVDPRQYQQVAQAQAALMHDIADGRRPVGDFRPEVATALRARAVQPWRGRPAADEAERRAAMCAAAEAIEQGRDDYDKEVVGKALRGWANALRRQPLAGKGAPAKCDHFDIAMTWTAALARDPKRSRTRLRDDLAAQYGVDVSTIRDAINACGPRADAFLKALTGK